MPEQFIGPVAPFGAADYTEDAAGYGDNDPGLGGSAVPERIEEEEREDGGVDKEEGPYYCDGAFVGVEGVGKGGRGMEWWFWEGS